MNKKILTKKLAKYSAAAGALMAVAGTAEAHVEIANITFTDGVVDGMLVTENDTAYIDFNNDGTPDMIVGIFSNKSSTTSTSQSSVLGTMFYSGKMGFIQPYGVNMSPTDVGKTAATSTSQPASINFGVLNEIRLIVDTNPRDQKELHSPYSFNSSLSYNSNGTLGSNTNKMFFVKKLQRGEIIDGEISAGGTIDVNSYQKLIEGDAFSPFGLVAFNLQQSLVPSTRSDMKQDNFPQHGETGFAAFRFASPENGESTFGWLEMEVNNVKSNNMDPYIKIGIGAMQQTPDSPIIAGDMSSVPFAPIATALGMGLIGLFGYLRRKKEA